jgi:hypothetical protein
MAHSVFYSWQSDSPSKTNRFFIRDCISKAIKELNKEAHIDDAVRLDQDTAGVPGTPDIATTIFNKITASQLFLADLSFCSQSAAGKMSPNPNVLIELGYAFSAIGNARVVCVMNTAFGEGKDLPFDLSHKRWPIAYALTEQQLTDADSVKKVKDRLTRDLLNAIRLVFEQNDTNTLPEHLYNTGPSLEYVESMILSADPYDDWTKISTDLSTTAVCNKDVNLSIVVDYDDDGVQQKNFVEDWANRYPHAEATGYWCDIYYGSTLVKRSLLVSVDGGRAMLPVPRQRGSDGKVTEVLLFDYRLAQMFDLLGTLEEYMQWAGLSVAFTPTS